MYKLERNYAETWYTANAVQMTPQTERGILQVNERKNSNANSTLLHKAMFPIAHATPYLFSFSFFSWAHYIYSTTLSGNSDITLAV
jgi:hypothetical protein